jgi:hypothetical protein
MYTYVDIVKKLFLLKRNSSFYLHAYKYFWISGQPLWISCQIFFWAQCTKTELKMPNEYKITKISNKIQQLALEYIVQIAINIQTFSISRHSKMCPNRNFWFANTYICIPSGNPDTVGRVMEK